MTDALVTTGMATRIADIEHKLNDLWAQVAEGDSVQLRATTLTLIMYTHSPETALAAITQVSERHPCRAIVISISDQSITPGASLVATPTLLRRPAFGHEVRTQISCELITLAANHDALDRVPGAVQGLLLADQPVFFLRQGDLSPTDPILKELVESLDGLIIDSAVFSNLREGLRSVLILREFPKFKANLYDLNWFRLLSWRMALAQQFELSNDRVALSTTNSVDITHKEARGTALLLFGWLADRLNWKVMPADQADVWTARSAIGTIVLRLKTATDGMSGLQKVTVGTHAHTYTAEYVPADNCIVLQSGEHRLVMSNTPMDMGPLLNQVLDQTRPDTLYENALKVAITLSEGAARIGERAGMIVVKNVDALSRIAARELILIARTAVKRNKRFSLALSGGSTPRALFELMATPVYSDQMPWSETHIFWGDERDVPTDHPDSNQRMAHEALLSKVPLPPGNIHGILTGQMSAVDAAARYASELRVFFGLGDADLPQFDLILLGLGDDGHTASLFPHTEALRAKGEALFVANPVPQLNTTRLTLTADVINSAAHVIFLVAGDKKASILYDVVRGPYEPDDHPAQRIHPAEGALTIIADQKAASRLRQDVGAP